MKKYIIAIVAGTTMVLSGFYFGAPSKIFESHANITKYENVDVLEKSADAIVVASPEKDLSELEPTLKYTEEGRLEDYYTVTNVKVKKVLKGDDIPKSIDVIQGAAFIKDNELKFEKDVITIEHFRPMEKGKKYLLFLEKKENGQYGILGVFQGKINVDDTDENEKKYTEEDKHYKKLKEDVIKKFKSEIDSN